MSLRAKVLSFILAGLMAITSSGAIYAYSVLNSDFFDTEIDDTQISVNDTLSGEVLNIALFGLDGRSDVDGDRTDTIMIVSVDFSQGTIKVTSVMRDLMVRIPGDEERYDSYEKINAAYNYGGGALTIKTLNENFDLNITDYVSVNFDAVVDIVDDVGGVEVTITDESVLEWTNKYIDDVNDKTNHHDPYLEGLGVHNLTGAQALAYSRNRYSDSDYGRTKRQREVLTAVAEKVLAMNTTSALRLLGKIYPFITTSMSLSEMTRFAQGYLGAENKQLMDFRIPTDILSTTDLINEVSYVLANSLADNAIVLHKFLYGNDVAYTPSENLLDISRNIGYLAGLNGEVTIDVTQPYDVYGSPSDAPDGAGSGEADGATEGGETTDTSEGYDHSTPAYEEPATPVEEPVYEEPAVTETLPDTSTEGDTSTDPGASTEP